ncbi:hypothetical protein T492DRAFT_906350, partial [Pavlovales sp. CCMP2436]
ALFPFCSILAPAPPRDLSHQTENRLKRKIDPDGEEIEHLKNRALLKIAHLSTRHIPPLKPSPRPHPRPHLSHSPSPSQHQAQNLKSARGHQLNSFLKKKKNAVRDSGQCNLAQHRSFRRRTPPAGPGPSRRPDDGGCLPARPLPPRAGRLRSLRVSPSPPPP